MQSENKLPDISGRYVKNNLLPPIQYSQQQYIQRKKYDNASKPNEHGAKLGIFQKQHAKLLTIYCHDERNDQTARNCTKAGRLPQTDLLLLDHRCTPPCTDNAITDRTARKHSNYLKCILKLTYCSVTCRPDVTASTSFKPSRVSILIATAIPLRRLVRTRFIDWPAESYCTHQSLNSPLRMLALARWAD